MITLPRSCAVIVENIELVRGQKLAAVDSWLDRSQTSQYPYLLNVTDYGGDFQALQLRVDGVKTSNQVLQKKVKRLGQTYELATVDAEAGDLSSTIIYHATLVVCRVGREGRGRVVHRG